MKRKLYDRKDGSLLCDIDSMHFVMPLIFPNRCDNEAFIKIQVDLTNAEEYLKEKNEGCPEYKYNLFQLVVCSILKTIMLRPKMNYFIQNKNMYERNEITAAFTVKKIFSDNGGEALAKLRAKEDDNIDTIHDYIYKQVSFCRSDKKDGGTESMDAVKKIPRPIAKMVGAAARFLDRHGMMPTSVTATDPYYSSVVISNLGSIKLDAGYHHLTNWGTTSVFCVIGEKKKRPYYDDDGNITMKMSLELGLTIDERLADGYYYSKTVRLLKTLLENPKLLELPLSKEIEY